jgi:hypothetical protein
MAVAVKCTCAVFGDVAHEVGWSMSWSRIGLEVQVHMLKASSCLSQHLPREDA